MIYSKNYYWKYIFIIIVSTLVSLKSFAQCNQGYSWTTWNNFNGTNATGSILVNGKNVGVTMTTDYIFGSTNGIYRFAEPFKNFTGYLTIPNSKVPVIRWIESKMIICFSEPVTNPLLLFSSLGNKSTRVTLSFSEPYISLFDGGNMKFTDDYSLTGDEGNAIILFPGIISCITINSSTREHSNITLGFQPPLFPINISEISKGCGKATLTASGGVTYKWNGGVNPNSATNTFDKSGIYSVTATDKNGCTAVALKRVDIIPKPIITSTTNKTICPGQNYFGYKSSGVYIDTLQAIDGCDSIRTINLNVLEVPQITFGNIKPFCDDEPIELTPQISPSKSAISYLWSSGETTKSIFPTKSGKYKLTVTQQFCSVSDSVQIIINPLPKIAQDDTTCRSKTIVAGIIDNNLSYLWEHSWEKTREIAIENEGIYKVKITNQFGCSKTRTITLKEMCNALIYTPNSFTPNSDGINDNFKVFIEGGTILRFDVFNQWGNKIYSEDNNNPQWDGTFNGEICPQDKYVYVLKYKNLLDGLVHEYFGTILLLR